MDTVLYLAHTQPDGTLGKLAFETYSAALSVSEGLGAPLVIGLIGADVQLAADAVASAGAERCLSVTGPDFAVSRYGSDAAAATALVEASAATLVLAPATSRFSRALPGVTQRLGGRIDTQVTGLEVEDGLLHIRRWYYRQRMEATLTRVQRPWMVLVAPGVFDPWEGPAGTAQPESVVVELADDLGRTRVQGLQAASTEAQTIRPDASLLFVAGAGWTKKQADGQTHIERAEDLILRFLEHSRASLGSSKSLVDQAGEGQGLISFMSHLNQVGQTGSTPRHAKGLATCCHGEEPHVVGWRFINERRAVNTDPSCGWAQGKADVLYVADAFEVMAKLNERLAATDSD